jgi:hypothetical protein
MSTFLELCQDFREEAGITGSGPVSVIGQTGEMKRVVNWILKAYKDIQNKHRNWDFLRENFSFETIASTSTYLPTAVSLDELATWKQDTFRIYRTATGVADEQWLRCWRWDELRDAYLIGPSRSQTGRPTEFAIKPDKSVVFWPAPDAVYTVTGEYFQRAQTMTANADEPLLPEQFHDIIKWRAMMYYGAYEGAAEVYANGKSEYARMMFEMRLDQLPGITLGGALA